MLMDTALLNQTRFLHDQANGTMPLQLIPCMSGCQMMQMRRPPHKKSWHSPGGHSKRKFSKSGSMILAIRAKHDDSLTTIHTSITPVQTAIVTFQRRPRIEVGNMLCSTATGEEVDMSTCLSSKFQSFLQNHPTNLSRLQA